MMQQTTMPAVCLNLRYFDRLAHALLRLTFHDSNDDDPVSGEIEGRRAVSPISCRFSPAVQ